MYLFMHLMAKIDHIMGGLKLISQISDKNICTDLYLN